ncbi:hypothetical protein DXT76_05405 [Halobacillus trueperi]|uniref:Uncharacterized protein n=1 Tax=Halobacillus trueperi TaxID=156205 RepID=A0A3D8VRB3_9BACI|nr:hypothetical protein [Halobacillus trueperi]RDY71860.1 hypothetical protein DXT76_05405 [Halobacillus trueperi]
MGKKLIIFGGLIIVVFCTYIYVDQRYFFNPIAFTQDDITPYHWSEYERPVTITYYDLETERKAYKLEQEKAVRRFLEEMKDSPPMQESSATSEVEGALKLSCEGDTLLEVYFYEGYWEILRESGTMYEMTKDLKGLIETL